MDSTHSEYVFHIRTVKASPFRTLVDAVKDILTEVNLEVDSTGINIMAMDGTHAILVHMKLYANRFDEFFCSENCITHKTHPIASFPPVCHREKH